MQVVVNQAGQHATAVQGNHLGFGAGQRQDVGGGAHAGEAAVMDGHGVGHGLGRVQRGEAPLVQDQVGGLGVNHGACLHMLRRVFQGGWKSWGS
ncbi:hypothetical protein D3C72_1939480 [compost metagenome]